MWEYDRQQAAAGEASARKTCDNCGREFHYGSFGNDLDGGGWAAKGRVYLIRDRYYHCCTDSCAFAIGRWANDNSRSVPRLIGRETVAKVLT